MRHFRPFFVSLFALLSVFLISAPALAARASVVYSGSLLDRVKGYILLQTESHGEAWYVDPVTAKRYYMKDGPTAYEMMRSFGLGVTESDYAKIAAGDITLKSRLRGRIVLRAQAHGEAYYIHPKDLTAYYLQNGDEAYRVMRLYSLGITNADLNSLASDDIPQVKTTATSSSSASTSAPAPLTVVQPVKTITMAPDAALEAWKPPHVSTATLTSYWLKGVNDVRAKKGLPALMLNTALTSAATVWAKDMGVKAEEKQGRSGDELSSWLATQGISVGADSVVAESVWTDYVADSQVDADMSFSRALDSFTAEGATGPDFTAITNANIASVGVGFYFGKLTYNNSRMFVVFEYSQ